MTRLWFSGILAALFLCSGFSVHAQSTDVTIDDSDVVTFPKGLVLDVLNSGTEDLEGFSTQVQYQTIRAKVLDGSTAGTEVIVDNNYRMLDRGDVFYFRHTVNIAEGTDTYAVVAPYRIPALLGLVLLFVTALLIFGGKQGIRGLMALLGSLFFIGALLIPGILHGYSPALVSIVVAALIVVLGSYITHGFTKTTTAAVAGMLGTILFTGVLAYVAIESVQLSGFASDEASYLNIQTRGTIDFMGLLLGSMLIGLLGVLYDAAIGQAVAVEELLAVGKQLSRWEVYKRAQRIGREHIGALVNTLAIAYIGVSMPLILYIVSSTSDYMFVLNQELFATELVRMMVGTIGIVLAVPITTAVAVYVLSKWPPTHQTHGHKH